MESYMVGEEKVLVCSQASWKEEKCNYADFKLGQNTDIIRFCKVERHGGYLFGTMRLPAAHSTYSGCGFAFYMIPGCLIFIDDSGVAGKIARHICSGAVGEVKTLERFLLDFLLALMQGDLLQLEELEKEICSLEEGILRGELTHFDYEMLGLKKTLSHLYRYYAQLTDMGEVLFGNELAFFSENGASGFRIFAKRAFRLQEEARVLREYAMQVQEVYQAQISIRQNDVMKMLTLVTTIFLPLTLVVGWYGMNFKNMPELKWTYGYPAVLLFSVAIVAFTLWLFRKKKFW